jgi:hypothetical protein
MSVDFKNGAPYIRGAATADELEDAHEFYFPTDGTKPPRQPASRFCQVNEDTLKLLIQYAIAWRLHAEARHGD